MKPKPDEHDRALFREATRGVKPLAAAPRVDATTPRPRVRGRLTRAHRLQAFEEPEVTPEDTALAPGDVSRFARPGVAASTLRQLRRGEFRVEAELDLHGQTAAAAQRQLREVLTACLRREVRCVRIVHGKGLRSGAHGPVLRQLVNSLLRRTVQVQAFASARPADGGTGALYVLLAPQTSSASTTRD